MKERIRTHLKDLLKEAAHLRPGEDEERTVKAIHKTRVLSRRLEALVSLLSGPEEDPALHKALKRYKKVRKALGRVRECDVHRAHWAEWAQGRPHFAVVDREIRRKREKLLDRFLAEFDWSGLWKAAKKLGKAVEKREDRPASVTARRRLAVLVNKILKEKEIHEVRLDVKRLRYTLEGLEALAGGRKTEMRKIQFLKELQSELGTINDLETMIEFLRKLRRKRADRWNHAMSAAVEKTADDLEGRLMAERHRWDKLWPQRKKNLREMT